MLHVTSLYPEIVKGMMGCSDEISMRDFSSGLGSKGNGLEQYGFEINENEISRCN